MLRHREVGSQTPQIALNLLQSNPAIHTLPHCMGDWVWSYITGMEVLLYQLCPSLQVLLYVASGVD